MKSPVGHALAGGALGLCVGVLTGMTTAPVVGTIVGALAALFATLFGVRLQDIEGFARIAGFGAACVLGVMIGVTLRTHNILGITVSRQVNEWVAAGFDTATARDAVLFRELGLLRNRPNGLVATPRAEKVPPSTTGSHLSGIDVEECGDTNPEKFGNDGRRIVQSYRSIGGAWGQLADALADLSASQQTAIAVASWRLACR